MCIRDRIGDVLLAQGDRAGALAAYRKGLAIAEKLAARDPANTDWQRDLSVSHNKIGDVLVAQGDGEGALEMCIRDSTYTVLAIDAHPRSPTHFALQFRIRLLTLTSMDMNFWDSSFRLLIDGLPSAPDSNLNELVPGNSAKDGMVSFQVPYDVRSLALRIIHHDSLGDISELPLRLTTSAAVDPGIPVSYTHLDVYKRQSLTIADEIAGQDVNNAQWQVDVAESCIKISELPLSDSSGQSAYRQRGLNILRALLETGRLLPNQDDGTGWFKRAMQALSEDLPQH